MDYSYLVAELGIKGYLHGDEYHARCPLHSDTNPSFSLNLNTGMWICFAGCGSGEFVRLVEVILNCSPQEAWDWAKSNGKSNSVEQLSKALAIELGQNPIATQVIEKDVSWFDKFVTLPNNTMPLWFLSRGFTWKTINEWDIRYDGIQDAVVIPVVWQGQMIGTVSRNYRSMPKYQNSHGLVKSDILFGEISKAKSEIIICEGVLDALWLWQLGYNAVSIMGTFISGRQIEILKEYRFGEITIALDNDEAGEVGTKEARRKLVQAGWLLPQIKILEFPEGKKDPNACSEDEFESLYRNRKDIIYGI